MELKNKAVSGFFWSFLIQSGHQLLSFLVSVILARLLNPSDFGILGMLYVFIVVGRSLVRGGLAQSLIRTKDADQDDY